MDICDLIGEATAYDKKQQLEVKRPKSWLKSVSAFANGEGGTLVFGVSDDDQVVGLVDAESDAERISEAIKTKLDPIPSVKTCITPRLQRTGNSLLLYRRQATFGFR